jgi:hypothetical protein
MDFLLIPISEKTTLNNNKMEQANMIFLSNIDISVFAKKLKRTIKKTHMKI